MQGAFRGRRRRGKGLARAAARPALAKNVGYFIERHKRLEIRAARAHSTAAAKSTCRTIAVLSLQVQPPLRPRQLEALPQPLELGIASHA